LLGSGLTIVNRRRDPRVPQDRLAALRDLDVQQRRAVRAEELPADEEVSADAVRIDPRAGVLHRPLAHEPCSL
jgi:hypothetical protein